MATITMTEEFKQELQKALDIVNGQIDEFINECTLQDVNPYLIKDAGGAYIYTSLLSVKVQLMSTMVEANKVIVVNDNVQHIHIPRSSNELSIDLGNDTYKHLNQEHRLLANVFRRIISDYGSEVLVALHGDALSITFDPDTMIALSTAERELISELMG